MMMTSTTETTTSPLPPIPKKSHFKLDEVCALTGVKPYVLRFWESEFEEISPLVSSTGQKVYEHKDITAIFKVKKLLFEKKWTLEQAKKAMAQFETLELDDLPPVPTKKSSELNPDQMKKLMAAKRALIVLLTKTEQLKKRYQLH